MHSVNAPAACRATTQSSSQRGRFLGRIDTARIARKTRESAQLTYGTGPIRRKLHRLQEADKRPPCMGWSERGRDGTICS